MNDFALKYATRRKAMPYINAEDTANPRNWAAAILERAPWVLHRNEAGDITAVEIDVSPHANRDTTVGPVIKGMLDLGFQGIEDKTATQGPWKATNSATLAFNFDPQLFRYGEDIIEYDFPGGHIAPPTRIVLKGNNIGLALNLLNREMEADTVAELNSVANAR